jgi:anti-sigma factor RsiW
MLDDSQNMQAVLLLYLAGELPADERADLEQRLAQDSALRQTLEELRSLDDGLTLMLKESDAIAIPAAARESRRSTAVRQISRAMVRRQLREDASESVAPIQIKRGWMRTWAYPIAAAVGMIALGVFFLTSNGSMQKITDEPTQVAVKSTGSTSNPQEISPGDNPNTKVTATTSETQSDMAFSETEHLLDVSDEDRNVLALSPSAYDVSSMFESPTE